MLIYSSIQIWNDILTQLFLTWVDKFGLSLLIIGSKRLSSTTLYDWNPFEGVYDSDSSFNAPDSDSCPDLGVDDTRSEGIL